MMKNTVFVEMDDGQKVALHTWLPDGEVKAVVQLCHGMAEFSMRYDRFGEMLAKNGIAFYAHDHRGHGETAGCIENLGYLADKDGFQRVVLDVRNLVKKAHEDFPGKKVFIFGHSFGSFVTQSFIEQFGDEISGAVICGSAGPRPVSIGFGLILANIIGAVKGKKSKATLLDGIAFGAYNKLIKDAATPFDWLSRDPAEVKKYADSPYCGFVCTNSFFKDMFTGLSTIHKPENMKKIPVNLPVFLIAGTADPVGNYGKTVVNLWKIYKANGISDLQIKLYKDARHELLNETNHEEVEGDVLNWLNSHM